jgi:hypothetical protein
MTERISYNTSSSVFPFEWVRAKLSSVLPLLRRFERNVQIHSGVLPKSEVKALVTFATALNLVLVWAAEREATSPQWSECDPEIFDLFHGLNELTLQIPNHYGPVSQLILLKRPCVTYSRPITYDSIITRCDSRHVRFTTHPPFGHRERGRELGMYDANAELFSSVSDPQHFLRSEFSIYEVGSNAQLYGERYSRALLSDVQMEEFEMNCRIKVDRWNWVMERLRLSYRFKDKWDQFST